MSLKILINGVTLDNATITPLMTNLKYWQKHNCQISIIGNKILKKKIIENNIIKIKSIAYIKLNENTKLKWFIGNESYTSYIAEAQLSRGITGLSHLSLNNPVQILKCCMLWNIDQMSLNTRFHNFTYIRI